MIDLWNRACSKNVPIYKLVWKICVRIPDDKIPMLETDMPFLEDGLLTALCVCASLINDAHCVFRGHQDCLLALAYIWKKQKAQYWE